MHLLFILNIVVTTNLVKNLGHELGRLYIGFGLLDMTYFFNSSQRIKKVKIFPHEGYLIFIDILLFWINSYNGFSIAYDIKTRRLLDNFCIALHHLNLVIKIEHTFRPVCYYIRYKNRMTIFSLIPYTFANTTYITIAISTKNTQQFINQLLTSRMDICEFFQCILSLNM